MNEPNILIWDIETAHAIAALFSLYQDSVPIQNVLQEWYIICASWKWLGKKQVYATSVLDDIERFEKDPNDDYHVLKTLRGVIEQADAIVHHYGDRFDLPKFNTRLLYHGLDPLPDIPQIDTYKICKNKFKFLSNKLDYVGQYLGVGEKITTSPKLWLRCLMGEKDAVREMVKYNKQDVELLERVYVKLAPFAQAAQRKLNMNLWYGDNNVCPTCGDANLHRRGYRTTRVSKFARFQCQSCGTWSSAPIRANGTLGVIR
jgi:hypothetical protein